MRGRVIVSGADRMTWDEFGMHNVPRCRNGKGESSWAARLSETGYSRRVTPLAFIHRRVRPLDGWMVVANPYHH